jgi:hypothetical protein
MHLIRAHSNDFRSHVRPSSAAWAVPNQLPSLIACALPPGASDRLVRLTRVVPVTGARVRRASDARPTAPFR